MAFAKTPKLCQDAPAGLQQLNGMADNLDSLKSDLELEHAPLITSFPAAGGVIGHGNYSGGHSPVGSADQGSDGAPGRHETELVARGVAYVAQQTNGSIFILSTYGVQLWSSSGCLRSLQVLSTGVYFFPITGFSKVWGRATPAAQGSTLSPPVDARVQPGAPTGTGGTGLIVKTFRLQDDGGGNDVMLPFHTGFHLVAYGRR